MIKGDKTVRKRLRQAVRQTVKANPALLKEYRRVKNFWWRRSLPSFLLRPFISCFLVGLMGGGLFGMVNNQRQTAIYCAFGYWALLVTIYRAVQIQQLFNSQKDLWIPYLQPIENAVAYRLQLRQLLLASSGLGMDFIAFGFVYACISSNYLAWAAFLPFALGQSVLSFSLGWIIFRWLPKRFFGWLMMITYALGFVLFIGLLYAKPLLLNLLAGPVATLISCTPGGWLIMGWQKVVGGASAGWLTLVAVPVFSVSAYIAYCRHHAAFNLETVFDYDGRLAVARIKNKIATKRATFIPSETPPPVSSLAQTGINTRSLAEKMAHPPRPALLGDPWLRWCLERVLTPRQYILLEVMQPGGVSFFKNWTKALYLVLFGRFVLGWFWSASDNEQMAQILIYGLAVLFALPCFLENLWVGFQSLGVFQTQQPLYAQYPVSIVEIARLYFKIGLLRCVASWPFLALALCVAVPPEITRFTVVIWSVKIVFILLLAKAWGFLLKTSQSTNDTNRLSWLSILLLGGGLISFLFLVGMTISFFYTSGLLLNLSEALLMTLICAVNLYLYLYFYNRSYFDLLRSRV